MKVTRDDLADTVAAEGNLTKKDVRQIVKDFCAEIQTRLGNGDEIAIRELGIFRVLNTKARTGVNPRTSEKVQIAASKRVSFRPGAALKSLVKA